VEKAYGCAAIEIHAVAKISVGGKNEAKK